MMNSSFLLHCNYDAGRRCYTSSRHFVYVIWMNCSPPPFPCLLCTLSYLNVFLQSDNLFCAFGLDNLEIVFWVPILKTLMNVTGLFRTMFKNYVDTVYVSLVSARFCLPAPCGSVMATSFFIQYTYILQ